VHARAVHSSKQTYGLRSVVFALCCTLALAVALILPPGAGAEHSEPVGAVETANPLSAAATVPGARFVHTATPANITSHWTEIDNPLSNENPQAIVSVTQNWNPEATGGTYNDHATGVWYNSTTKRWAIFNQDKVSMLTNTHFNVMVRTPGADTFVHTATPANSAGHRTDIDNPLSNGSPNAIVLVTQNYNPGGGGGVYNDRAIGVWYRSVTQRWAVFNQAITGIPTGASCNVVVIPRYKYYTSRLCAGTRRITGPRTWIHSSDGAEVIRQGGVLGRLHVRPVECAAWPEKGDVHRRGRVPPPVATA
jgi:hypothetical protein